MKLMLRIILVITVGLCVVLLLGTFTPWFSTPVFIIYVLKGIGGILFVLAITLIAWGATELISMPKEERKKGLLGNPVTELVSGGIYSTLLTIMISVVMFFTNNLSTAFQEEALDLLNKILIYVKGP